MNMNTVARRILRWIWGPNREGIVLSVLVLLTIIMSAISPAFFTVSTLFSLLRSSIVPMIYALGVLLVIISGGIDVSFAAIASFASYATIVFQLSRGINIGLVGSFAMALAIGALLGLLNGYLISRFKLPTLIVTLGTQGIFQGFLLAYIGSKYIAQLPEGMASASTANLVSVETSTGVALLHSRSSSLWCSAGPCSDAQSTRSVAIPNPPTEPASTSNAPKSGCTSSPEPSPQPPAWST